MELNNSLPVGSSVVFQLTLTNPLKDSPAVNDADVEVVVKDPEGNEVAGQTWPLTLPYVSASAGIYRETVPPITGLVAGVIYEVIYTATGADGVIGEFCTSIKAKGCG